MKTRRPAGVYIPIYGGARADVRGLLLGRIRLRRVRWLDSSAADLDRGSAEQAAHNLAAIAVLHKHVLAALGVGTLNGEHHGRRDLRNR
jgi:hypothetical protein